VGKLRLLLLLEEEQDGRRCPPRAEEEEEEEEEEEAVGFADDAAEEEEKSRRSAALCIGPFPKRFGARFSWGHLGKKKIIFWTRRNSFFSSSARASRSKNTRKEREREGTVAVVLYAVHVHFVLVVSGVVERREKTDIRFGKQRGFHHASADCFRYDDYDDDERDDGTTNASGR
jgi:hypothetical protein